MTKTEFQSIRGESDFLCRYFNKVSNSNLDNRTFSTLLSMWLMHMGLHPQEGLQIILNFLDKKHQE
jgi:hypothetical protein